MKSNRLEDFIGLSSDVFWELDRDGRYTFVSRPLFDGAALPVDAMLGAHPWDIEGVVFLDGWEAVQEVMDACDSLHDQIVTMTVADQRYSFIMRAQPVFDQSGKFSGYRGVTTDITPYVRIRDSMAVVSEDLQGSMGKAFFDQLVKSLAELLHLDIVFVGELPEGQDDCIRTVSVFMDGGFVDNFEYKLKDTPCEQVVGKSVCYFERDVARLFPDDEMLEQMGIESYAGVPLFDSNNNALGILVGLRRTELTNADDVVAHVKLFSARTEAEIERTRAEAMILKSKEDLEAVIEERTRDLLQAKEEAEEANKSKSLFLSSMSHELRTPLNAILGFAELLKMHPEISLSEKQQEYVSTIVYAGNHLLMLINDLLDLSKIDAGQIEMSIDDVQLCSVVEASFPLVMPLAERMNVEIACGKKDPTLRVQADQTRVEQIMVNLLSNAVKYNEPGGTVRVNAHEADGKVTITVSDTGVGIPVDVLERLFIPFDRLGREASTIEGSGIGLTISKNFATLMGGDIEVESTEGKGSTFTLTLPSSA